MAIALEQSIVATVTTGNITLESWTPGNNELLLLMVGQNATGITPSISGNGMTWDQVATVTDGQSVTKTTLYRAMGTPSSGAITVTLTGNTAAAGARAFRISGVDTGGTNGSGAIEASTSTSVAGSDNNDLKISITTLTNNAWAAAFSTHRYRATFITLTLDDETALGGINTNSGTGNNDIAISAFYQAVATAGATQLGSDNNLSGNDEWSVVAISIKPSTGTNYNQNVSGAITPTGALLKSTTKKPAGSITPTGSIAKQVTRALTGAITPVGTVIKQARKILAGAVDSSGALAAQKLVYKVLTGTVDASGSLLRATTKIVSGSLTPSATLLKHLARALSGTVGSSGALTAQRLIFIALSGTVGSSGALVKQASKILTGAVSSAGSLVKRIARSLGGSITPTGGLSRSSFEIPIRQLRRGTIYQQGKLAFLVTAPPWSNSGYATDHTQDVTGYDHTHAALGGFWSANLTMRLPLHDLEDWLEYGVGRQVQVKGRGTKTAWEGIVNRVSVNVGGYNMTVGPYLDIANKVKLAYSIFLQLGGGNATGIRVVTEPTSNLSSQAKYGILAKVFSVGGIDSSAVAGLQAMLLERYSQPPRSEDLNLPGDTGLRYIDLKLECIGYAHLLQKYTYNSTTAGTQNLSAKLAAIVAAEPNALFSSSVATNTIQVPATQTDDAEAWGLIKAMIAMGDTSLNRYTFGVYENRRVTYKAVDNNVVYVRPLREGASVIQDAQGGLLQPWEVRPGSYVLVTDLLPGKPVASDLNAEQRAIFADTVQYRMPDSLVINGAHAFRIEQRMAQMGLSGVS